MNDRPKSFGSMKKHSQANRRCFRRSPIPATPFDEADMEGFMAFWESPMFLGPDGCCRSVTPPMDDAQVDEMARRWRREFGSEEVKKTGSEEVKESKMQNTKSKIAGMHMDKDNKLVAWMFAAALAAVAAVELVVAGMFWLCGALR